MQVFVTCLLDDVLRAILRRANEPWDESAIYNVIQELLGSLEDRLAQMPAELTCVLQSMENAAIECKLGNPIMFAGALLFLRLISPALAVSKRENIKMRGIAKIMQCIANESTPDATKEFANFCATSAKQLCDILSARRVAVQFMSIEASLLDAAKSLIVELREVDKTGQVKAFEDGISKESMTDRQNALSLVKKCINFFIFFLILL